MGETQNPRVVLVMAGAESEAQRIARALVQESLAACANIIGPAHSIYRWRGAIEEAQEFLIIIKTRASLFAELERRVRELHSYEVPEIISCEITAGSAPYLDWIASSTREA